MTQKGKLQFLIRSFKLADQSSRFRPIARELNVILLHLTPNVYEPLADENYETITLKTHSYWPWLQQLALLHITMATNGDHPDISLKKQLGLISTTSYIVGSIIGVGIFISPTAVLEGVGSSVGLSLIVWALCGALTYCAAMCYAEYGTRVKKSGGTYTYIREAFGDLAGFVFLWTQLVIVRPLSIGLASLTAAEYIVRPAFLSCPDMAPTSAKAMLGFVILGKSVTLSDKICSQLLCLFKCSVVAKRGIYTQEQNFL
ncbi:putative L-type amino acid transporter 1-like protein MLAS [Haliotis rufescens]|uniref:putative L-type amino acid transporter 1-like protein MLAS n=1 Tax=Haliotis rufescens TaxID=6454 RepID=UPI00201F0511|nr:putative L-type amino acid transporter 1-like protein MLAS [Haliotis rufescens]